MTLILRASGPALWPQGQNDLNASVDLTGEIVFTIPIAKNILKLQDMSVDVHFSSSWTNTIWPDTSNVMFSRLPFDAFLYAWTSELNKTFAIKLSENIKKIMLLPQIQFSCAVPTFVPMMCTSAMKTSNDLPNVACHPCDKCCKCFVQQRCDGGCDECACLNCNNLKGSVLQYCISFLIIFYALCISWNCYKKSHNI